MRPTRLRPGSLTKLFTAVAAYGSWNAAVCEVHQVHDAEDERQTAAIRNSITPSCSR